jgi:secreted PhoX family phosphatase
VSAAASRRWDRRANSGLLEAGTLHAASAIPGDERRWIPLLYGVEPLVERNRFHSQAEVLLNVRRAARLVTLAAAEHTPSRGDGEVRV